MTVTVFTPTYNRAYCLDKLYQSLLLQDDKDFEWVIVDDGSADNTEELVEGWKAGDNGFDIVYYKQQNAGKHVAINTGVNLARGELFFIIDSDDCIAQNAIAEIKEVSKSLPNINKFAGIAGVRRYKKGDIIGTTFSDRTYVDATSLEREKFGISGDKAEVFFTDVLKRYPFPTFGEERFLTESSVWYKIAADGYKLRWVNMPWIIGEYIEDGLTVNSERIKQNNPMGYLYYYKMCYQYQKGLRKKFAAIYNYAELASSIGKTEKEIRDELGVGRVKLKCAYMSKKLFGHSK